MTRIPRQICSPATFELVKSVPADSVVALYKAGGWWKEGVADRRLIPKIVKNSFAFAVARNGRGKIIGMGRVISDGCSDAYIQDVVVLSAWRGKGIGTGIIKALADYCLSRRIAWIGLVAAPGTYPFYRGTGFKDKKGFQLMLLAEKKKS